MVNFVIRGTLEKVSKEELRCMLQAQATVLEFHKKKPQITFDNEVHVLVTKSKTTLGKTKKGKQAIGRCEHTRIVLASWLDFKQMFTTSCHEVIHYFNPDFPRHQTEKLTTTLNSKLNPTVAMIYNILIEGIYERAGYIAHTKISYKPNGEDFYDSSEWNIAENIIEGKKYRKFGDYHG